MGRVLGKAVGGVSKAIGLTGLIRHDKPPKESELAMPDSEAIERDAKKRAAKRYRKSGRVSTILDGDEPLGGI